MAYYSPSELFDAVVDCRNRGDLTGYLRCYESTATIVPQPGTIAHGHEALKAFLEFFMSLHPTFTVIKREFVGGEEIVLHLSAWTLTGTGPQGESINWNGRTCDVLRKQADGSWLVAIDNPWGTSLLD